MAIHNDLIDKIPNIAEPWDQKTGQQVEDFISRNLDASIASFQFDQSSSILTGYNVEGRELCSTTVVNSTPIYVPKLEIVNIRINSNNNNLYTGQDIKLNQPSIKKLEVGIKFIVEYEILGNTYYGISPQNLKFSIGNNTINKPKVIPNAKTDLEAIQYVDITELFNQGVSNGILEVSCAIDQQSAEAYYGGKITAKKITITYTNKGYIEGNIVSFNIAGLDNSEISEYQLVYFDNGSTHKEAVPIDLYNKVDLELSTGVHQLYLRIESKADANAFYSNWIQTNLIVDCNNIQGNAVAVINSVPTEINNCSNALLYKICYASGTNGGDIVINSYLSEDYDGILEGTPFNSTTLSLMGGEDAGEKEFYSYFELETVTERDVRFIGFTVNDEVIYSYRQDGSASVNYFTVAIIESPYNVNNAFNHVPGAILDYSQINGSGSNVFNPENIQLQPGDGWGIDGKYTAFQVSASGQNLFKSAIDMSSYLNNGFTFEFLLRTYNSNSNDHVLRIGNILIGPGYVRVYEDEPEDGYELDGVFVNSKADFQKDAVTHILITYTKAYLPKTYVEIYNQLLNSGNANYSTSSDITPYNVLKIYINGVINREIQLEESQLKQNGTDFKFQVYPTGSDVKLYGIRAYNHAFNYKEIQKNFISSLLDLSAKKAFYDKNDILDDFGKISLKKCINKYNVIVYAIPTNDAPLYYGNKKVAGDEKSAATLLIHYANPDLTRYNGRMWGGKYKAQGSSAKKYLIHNCQYNIKEGNFLTESEIEHNKTASEEEKIAPRSYYQMPNSDIKAMKFVGKVNYASSMQSHKQGSCNTYDDAYKSIFSTKTDTVFPIGGRKACLENEFLYFYYNITPEQSLDTITIQDTLENAQFMGFQTWGSAKADNPTYGYDKKKTPEYLLMEGADNGNPGANFKVPWAAFQTYNSELDSLTEIVQQTQKVTREASVENGRYTKGLLISDETIKYGVNNDPLDVDYGATEYDPHYNEDNNKVFKFTDAVKLNSLPYFAEFFNAMYQYDFTCYVSSTEVGISKTFDVAQPFDESVREKKIYIDERTITITNSKDPQDSSITQARRFDVFRWDAVRNKWVPAGLHHSDSVGGTWEPFNLIDKYDEYTSSDLYLQHVGEGINLDVFGQSVTDSIGLNTFVFPAMRYMFMWACDKYLDVEDIAFHQAMIRVLSGTDNRAKNTYFQIIGRIYENGEPTDKGDYKIRLMQDDMDTIFATDNNGQQNKEYYLLEPAFNKDTEGRWGDDHSSLFYPFDLCYAKQINQYTGYIIDYLLESSSVENEETKLYDNFLRIQKYFPAIAYNHTAEIYYEVAQTVFQNATKMYENGDFKNLLDGYVNNSVANPLSLSHGSAYEGEVQFLNDRLLLLATLTGYGSGLQVNQQSLVSAGTGEGNIQFNVKGKAKYTDYFYPNYLAASSNYVLILNNANTQEIINYDSMLNSQYILPNSEFNKTIIGSLAVPGDPMYTLDLTGPTLTGFALSNSNKYKYLEITEGLDYLRSLLSLNSAAYLIIDGVKTNYKINIVDLQVYKFLPVIEELTLTNVQFNNTVIDFRNCNRLRKLNLSGCSKIESIILPEGGQLTEVILPACVKEISIINNPKLSSITFEDGTKLNKLTINCNGVSSEFDVNDLIRKYFDFSDPQLLKLTGGGNLDLDVVSNISILGNKASLQGTYTIVEESVKADISYQLKKDLVKSFGNIDSKNNGVFFDYTSTVITKDNALYEQVIYGCSFTDGSDNIFYPFDSISFTEGNDVVVNDDGTLNITYWLDPKAPATLDNVSGKMVVTGNSTVEYNYKVTIYSIQGESVIIEGKIYFGYREPEVGDFAYADGTFSGTYINSKTLVGMVFAKRDNIQDSSKLDLTILSNKTVDGLCSPDYYLQIDGQFNTEKAEGINQNKVFNLLTQLFYQDNVTSSSVAPLNGVGIFNSQSYSPYYVVTPIAAPSDTITTDTDSTTYPSRSGKLNTYKYKNIANEHLKILAKEDSGDFGKFMKVTNSYMSTSNEMKDITSEDFSDICTYFNARLGSYVPQGGNAQGSLSNNSYAQLLYPVFYHACLFAPSVKSGETLLAGYAKGNWYIPSVEETRVLIAHRIKSTYTSNNANQTASDWDSDAYNGKGIFKSGNKAYFNGFLELLGSGGYYSYMTSDITNTTGFSIVYGEYYDYYSSLYRQKWFGSWTYSAETSGSYSDSQVHVNCKRDKSYTMPLCCEVTVDKKL